MANHEGPSRLPAVFPVVRLDAQAQQLDGLYQTMTPEYLASVRDEYGRRKDALVAALSKLPGVTHSSPEGAFYVMATLPVDDAEKLQYFLLQEFEDQGDTAS